MKRVSILIVFLLTITFFASCKKYNLEISGSETMYPMLQILADDFNSSQRKVRLAVYGGGSKLGIKRLVMGQVAIAASSNDIEETVLNQLADIDIFERLTIAFDGIAIVTNKKNSIKKLHLAQLSDIFSGKIKNWKEVGGEDMAIKVIIRNDKSGTASYMKKHVLQKKDLGELIHIKFKNLAYTKNAIVVKNNRNMAALIAKNKGAIGYMGMGSAVTEGKKKVKIIKYSRLKVGPYHAPSVETVEYRKYQLSRPLMLIYKADKNPAVKKLKDYLFSKRGQNRIYTSGYLESLFKEIRVRARRILKKKK